MAAERLAAGIGVVGVVGAGTMGAGIAQVAAAAGCRVLLHDVSDAQLQRAVDQIGRRLRRAVERGRLNAAQADATLARIRTTTSLDDLAPSDVVIEAAPEDMDLKRRILGRLGEICSPEAVLTSNTSSLSITALGAASGRPDRFAGLHFFNPAPVMPLVEIIAGHGTAPGTVRLLEDLSRRFGKTPVIARDTPGFIVNRVARPFYGEALRLLGEGLVDVSTADRVVRAAGFRMGPFELMDLIGIDVNFAVTCSVWEAYFHEARYRPHPIQRRLVEAGALGRKTGRGFYRYEEGADPEPVVGPAPVAPPAGVGDGAPAGRQRWFVTGGGPAAEALAARAQAAGIQVERSPEPREPEERPDLALDLEPAWGEERLRRAGILDDLLPPGVPLAIACWGGTLRELRAAVGPDRPLAGFNLWVPLADEPVIEWVVPVHPAAGATGAGAAGAGATGAGAAGTGAGAGAGAGTGTAGAAGPWLAALTASRALAAAGFAPAWVGDAPGGVVGRIVSMLVNEAAFAVAEGVAEPAAIDTAMKLGTNYPRGPWAWYAEAAPLVRAVLEGLHRHYREERYRPAPLLVQP